jgi:hypothetical protein
MTLAPWKAGTTSAFYSKKFARVSCCTGGAPKVAARAKPELDELEPDMMIKSI